MPYFSQPSTIDFAKKRTRRPHDPSKSAPAMEWGPSTDPQVPILHQSPTESRDQKLREALLGNRDSHVTCSSAKARKSVTMTLAGCTQGIEADDILAYVHKVRPSDTLAGVVLTYDIESDALRKANRLWPNDNIQSRTQLLLPVDNCAVKGQIVNMEHESESQATLSTSSDINCPFHNTTNFDKSQLYQDVKPIPIQKHHSFVHIDSVGVVEIIKLPRPHLSHFPPSVQEAYDEGDTSFTDFEINDRSIGQVVSEIAKDSLDGLEVVGAAIESFVKKLGLNTKFEWMSRKVDDTIELTPRADPNAKTPKRTRSVPATHQKSSQSRHTRVEGGEAKSHSIALEGSPSVQSSRRRRRHIETEVTKTAERD